MVHSPDTSAVGPALPRAGALARGGSAGLDGLGGRGRLAELSERGCSRAAASDATSPIDTALPCGPGLSGSNGPAPAGRGSGLGCPAVCLLSALESDPADGWAGPRIHM